MRILSLDFGIHAMRMQPCVRAVKVTVSEAYVRGIT